MPPRSPGWAAVRSALWIGGGQLYNKQLEKAVLFWIWSGILLAVALLLLVLGGLATTLPAGIPRPPLGDWIAAHAGAMAMAWMLLTLALWGLNIRDAYVSAGRINRGEIVIRYPLRRQLVHVVGSQLLGFLPLVGFLVGPGVVAEALDAAHDRRRPDHRRLAREGVQTLVEWALTRLAVYGLVGMTALWILWWVLRVLRLAP